jgi:hypothetical protein
MITMIRCNKLGDYKYSWHRVRLLSLFVITERDNLFDTHIISWWIGSSQI